MKLTIDELRKTFESSQFFNFIGFDIIAYEQDNVKIALTVRDELLNVNQTVHGGVYASVLDMVSGMTIRAQEGYPVITMNLTIHYLAPITEGKMLASAKIIQKGYKTVIAESEITDNDGRLLAKASGTFKINRKED